MKRELDVFVRTVRGSSPPAVSGEEGRAALAVAVQVLNQMEG